MKKIIAITCSLIITFTLVLASQPRVSAQKEGDPSLAEQQLLDSAARRLGLDAERLELLTSTTVELPLTGRRVLAAKVLVKGGDEVIPAAVGERGEDVDLEALKAEEERERVARFGKLDPKLHAKTQRLAAGDRVRVAFWLNPAEDLDAQDPRDRDGRDELSDDEAERLLAFRAEQVKASVARANETFARALASEGYRVEESGEGAPVVFASVPAGLTARLAERDDVQFAYLAEESGNEDYMNIAAPSIKADWLWWFGFTGVGSRIAIVEDSRVDFDNSCLPNNLGTRVPGHANVDDHATSTAGMAANTSGTHRGIAPGAGIYSANGTSYSDANMSAALDAGANNAHVLNNSWGPNCGAADSTMDVHARHADYIVRYRWDTVTAAAGNNGQCANGEFVDGVAGGYNVIAVGNYNDMGTVGVGDNTMNASSSFKDPASTHGDREKPEVAAPGTSITSTIMTTPGNCALGNVGSGTSYSAPMVAGVAAGLMQARPGLRVYPESVKAIIMAGAGDNVEGAARLSEFDGVGGVNALASFNTVNNSRYTWQYVTPSSFDASGYINVNMGWINAGQRVKVALVWDSNPTANYASDPLNADLDLYVVGPANFHSSASWDNAYETVDFTAAASGMFQLRIRNYRFNGANEYVAAAWSLL
jgi:hypothetical protein